MMNECTIALIMPTYNMAQWLDIFIRSLVDSGTIQVLSEIIFINDGSTDETYKVLHHFKNDQSSEGKVKIINFGKNQGRYQARLQGAVNSKCTHLLFLDSRVELTRSFATSLLNLKNKYQVIQGTISIPIDESIYSLYWERSHRYLFAKHFQDQSKGFWLTLENYEEYTSGTGVFYCSKDVFIQTCQSFVRDPISDDRALIKKIIEIHPIWVTEELSVIWRPRQNLISFLERLWERGPSFVSYHVYGHGSPMRLAVMLGGIVLMINIICLFLFKLLWVKVLIIELLCISMSIFLFTKNIYEVLKLMGLHFLVVMTFGVGILRGLYLECPIRKPRDIK